ncbi:hypothetical protein ACFVTJ_17960 [Agrobacterium sp. NPDC058088]|uniref:hypothetical protein n=1 Tax=Agrobacterium sp. NPDC058088 TaxID=3346335 RepID=UPI0036DF0399
MPRFPSDKYQVAASKQSEGIFTIFSVFLAFAALSIACSTLWFVIRHHMVMPFYDDVFDQSRYFDSSGSWGSIFTFLISPHNEHRIATTRILMILDMIFFQGKEYLQIFVSSTLHIFVSFILFFAAFGKDILKQSLTKNLILYSPFAILAINPNYMYTFLVPFQVQHAIAATLCVITATEIGNASKIPGGPAISDRGFFLRLIVLGFVATFTLGNAPVILLSAAAMGVILRWRFSTIAILLAIGTGQTYAMLAGMNSVGSASRNLLEIFQFLSVYLGGPLMRYEAWPAMYVTYFHSVGWMTAFGCAVLFVGAVFAVWRFIKPGIGGTVGATGLALLAMVIATGLAGGYSRAQFGFLEASNKKYASFAALGLIASLLIVTSILQSTKKGSRAVIFLYTAVLLVIMPVSYSAYIREGQIWQKASDRNKEAALAVSLEINSLSLLGNVSSPAADVATYVAHTKPRNLGAFSLFHYKWGDDIEPVLSLMKETSCRGQVESLSSFPNDDLANIFKVTGTPAIVKGWSWMDGTRAPADTILVVDAKNKIAGIARTTRVSEAAEEWLGQKFKENTGWYGFVRTPDLGSLRFYAIGRRESVFCQFASVDR